MPVPSGSVALALVPVIDPFLELPLAPPLDRWGVDDADLRAWAGACLKLSAGDPVRVLSGTLTEADELFPGLAGGLGRQWVRYATTVKVSHPAGRLAPPGGGFRFLGGLTALFLAAGIEPSATRSWTGPATGNDLAATAANESFMIERLAQMTRARGWAVAQHYGAWSVHSLRVGP